MKLYKKIFITSVTLMIPSFLMAQSAIDAYQFSRPDMKGTARFMSMGGAFGALGGDLSVLSQNPGGIGLYRNHEFGVTMDIDIQNSGVNTFDSQTDMNQTKVLLGNIGYIGTLRLNNDVIPNINFGFTYNKSASFNRKYVGQFSQLDNSLSNYIANDANNNGLTVGDLMTTNDYDPYNPIDGGYVAPWISILGFDSYLINPSGNQNDTKWQGLYGQKTKGTAMLGSIERGGIDEYNISFGGNFSNFLYWGMDFGITDLNYTQTTIWNEALTNAIVNGQQSDADWTLSNDYSVKGNGFNYKLGIIVRPIHQLRLGVAFHTPTYYSMQELYYGEVEYQYNGSDIRPGTAQTNNGSYGYNEYRFHTPWRLIVSAAGVLDNRFIVSADYEWTGTQGMNFSDRYDNFGSIGNSYIYENKDIDRYYRATNTFRLGVECRLSKQLSVRAGYSNVSSPVKQETYSRNTPIYTSGTRPSYTFDSNTNYVSCGLGYRYKSFYIDAAYVYKNKKAKWVAYDMENAPDAELSLSNHQLVFSTGIKF